VASTTAAASTLRRTTRLRPVVQPADPSAAYRFFPRDRCRLRYARPGHDLIRPDPSAASSTIRAGGARPVGIDGDLSYRASSARSEPGNPTTVINSIAKATAKLSNFVHATPARSVHWRFRAAEQYHGKLGKGPLQNRVWC
jgi:hypothetical protein